MILVYAKGPRAGEVVNVGDKVVTFRGIHGIITGLETPRHQGSTGRIHLKENGSSHSDVYYPSVIGATWVDSSEPTEDEGEC